jgi:hypothetical protein
MQPTRKSAQEIWSASLLRRDLNARAQHLATTHRLLHDQTTGSSPSIIFGCDEHSRHGNFHPASYAAILANPDWAHRLTKTHTAHRRSRARADWHWMELDCASSSDALLMNIFCHPGVFNGSTISPSTARLLNIDPNTQPRFGITPGIPLNNSRKTRSKKPPEATNLNTQLTDRTEIDLQLGNLFVEAKLTESSFQTAAPRLIERYRDLEAVFDITSLPRRIHSTPAPHPPIQDFSQLADEIDEELDQRNKYELNAATAASNARRTLAAPNTSPSRTLIDSYQLIRNVLAAYASNASFCVLCDARRRDLIEAWYAILSAVHSPTFATRLKLLTWQELSTTLPHDLRQFLETKYGIHSS